MENVILKKGVYYIGDPYCLFDKSLKEVLEQYNNNTVCEIFNEKCFIHKTKNGDGYFIDNYFNVYYVDSGLIGILPLSLYNIDNKEDDKYNIRGYNFIKEFKDDFKVSYEDGIFQFDTCVIDTNFNIKK